MTSYGIALFLQHAELLEASGIPVEHARARNYQSVDTKTRLEGIGITKSGRNTPGLLVPQLRPDGSVWGYQYRPDSPRLREGKPVKYETPTGQRNGIDVPPGVGPQLDDASIPLWVTEGVRKADAAAVAGLCCIALPGVWSWVGKGGVAIPDWRDIVLDGRRVVLAFDSDVVRKRAVRGALDALASYLSTKGARIEYLHLPDDDAAKTGIDDFLAAGNTADDLWKVVRPEAPAVAESPAASAHARPPAAAESPLTPSEPINGAVLLDDVERFLGRFVAFPSDAARIAVTLWTAHAHLIQSSDNSPRLALLSPEPGSGKTRTLEVLDLLTPTPMHSLSASPAAIFRTLNVEQPTLLMDEVDAIFGRRGSSDDGSEDLRALLNASHRKGATIPRCVGPRHDVVKFPVYAAVALAGLGDLPDTLMSRSIIIRMRRRAPGERVEPFRPRLHEGDGGKLRDALAEWADAIRPAVVDAWPQMPAGVEDRPADVWEPLLAIADAADRHWPDTARSACVELCKVAESREASLGVRLLTDLRKVFGTDERLPTDTLLRRLHDLDEAPWADLRGKALDARGLARRLSVYGIRSHQFRDDGDKVRGYSIAGDGEGEGGLYDPWQRYLSPIPGDAVQPVHPVQPRSEAPDAVPVAERVPVQPPLPVQDDPPLTSHVPAVPDVPDHQMPVSPAVCAHGVEDGNEPDLFVGGRLRCTECRAEGAS